MVRCRGNLWWLAGVRSTPLRDIHRRCVCRGDHVGAKSAFAPGSCSAPIHTAALPLLSKPNPLSLGFGLGIDFEKQNVGASCARPLGKPTDTGL